MARQLYRSGSKFLGGVLQALNQDADTPYENIVSAVAEDEEENASVDKVLNVLDMSKHVTKTGEGANASYRLTASGLAVREQMKGL